MEIVEGAPIVGLEVSFDPGVRVQGRVSGLAGEHPCTATVVWRSLEDPGYSRQVTTGEGGEYGVGGLVPGDYEVTVTPEMLAATWSRTPTTIQVTLGDEKRVSVNLEAELGAGLLVEVSSRDGEPMPGVQVRYTVNREGRGVSGFLPATGPGGYTRVCGLPRDGRLLLDVPAGDAGTARKALDLRELPREVRLVLVPARVVEGRALDAQGRPLSGARVAAARRDGGVEEVTRTDDSGAFRLHGLEPGEWELRASLASPPIGTVEDVRLPTNRSLDSVRLELTEEGAVSGTVVDASGAPVAGALVRLRGETVREETRSRKSGGFVFAVPPREVWEVIVETSEEGSPVLMRGVVPGRSVQVVLPLEGGAARRLRGTKAAPADPAPEDRK
jgi:protocatechuate 3,4-dioxygenase beta subunit